MKIIQNLHLHRYQEILPHWELNLIQQLGQIYHQTKRDKSKGRSVARCVLFYQDELGEFKNSTSPSEDTLFKTSFLWGYLPNLFITAV